MLAKHYASLFQPQYVDGLLNPSHRILSFTTMGEHGLGVKIKGEVGVVGTYFVPKSFDGVVAHNLFL